MIIFCCKEKDELYSLSESNAPLETRGFDSHQRIADHAVNIAKDVIYMIDGEIVRHAKLQAQREAQTTSEH